MLLIVSSVFAIECTNTFFSVGNGGGGNQVLEKSEKTAYVKTEDWKPMEILNVKTEDFKFT